MGHRTTSGAPLTLVWNFLLRSGSRYGAQGHLWGSLWGTGPSLWLSMSHYVAHDHLLGSLWGSLWGRGPSLWLSMGTGPSIELSMGQRSIYGAQGHL